MKIIGLCILGIVLTSLSLKASIGDTIIVLKEVRTTGVRFGEFSTGARILPLDTNLIISYQTSNVAELLAQNSFVSVRTYGPSGLSNISMRGGSTRHTAIIWNGFNISSPMTGSMNFSSMPAGFIENITVQSGASSTMYGSGASTGIIFLDNSLYNGPSEIKGSVLAEAASFGTYSMVTSIAKKGPKVSSRLKLGYMKSDNDFKYVAQTFGKPVKYLEHAGFERYGFSQQNAVQLGLRTKLETDFWYTFLFKNIPSLKSDASQGTAEQSDDNIRGAVILSHYLENFTIKARSGVFYDKIYYVDTVPSLIESNNRSFSWINEIETRYRPMRTHDLNIGANHTFEQGRSSGYIADTGRTRISIYGRYTLLFLNNKLNLSLETRQEFVVGEDVPFVFSLGTQYELSKNLYLKDNLSKHYKLPILDDLFWAEDAFAKGNPNLVPEYGWNLEEGIMFKTDIRRIHLSSEITLFRNRIYNQIIWLPGIDGKWTPTNINNSLTRGIEFSTDLNIKMTEKLLGGLRYLQAFTDAKIYSGDNIDEATQRLYVPKWKSNFSLYLKYKGYRVSYFQSYESKRYFDDIGALKSYVLADIIVSNKFPVKYFDLNIYFKVKNLFNVDYQFVNGYAQPLRNYVLGINFTF